MIIRNLYEKSLPIMNNKVIKYNICENKYSGQTHYGIQIIEEIGRKHNEEMIESISPNKNFVYGLLSYLCENTVDTVHFKDIVDDYILKNEYYI